MLLNPSSPTQRRRSRGSAMVEMVIVLPVLIMLVFGVGELGVAMGRYALVVDAAHSAARVATLVRQTCNAGQVAGEATTAAVEALRNRLGMNPGAGNVQVAGACSAGQDVLVTVTVPHDFPVLSAFTNLAPQINLSEVAVRANVN